MNRMSCHDITVATRKGLFHLTRDTKELGSWSIHSPSFSGDPVTIVLHDSRDGSLYAALNLGHFGVKLHRSRDRGKTWEECSAPCFPPQPESTLDKDSSALWSVIQIWSLEAGGADEPGVLWAGTIPGGLFRSQDRGDSWELMRGLWDRPERANWFGGGYDHPGIHSICVDPRNSRHLTLAVSCGGVWQTYDNGETWACTTKGMRAAYMPPGRQDDPSIQDPHRMVHCISNPDVLWVQHHNGIFRSTDSAEHWTEIIDISPSTFGFAVASHPADPNTAWFVPAMSDECRIPIDGNFVVTRTQDGGKTFDTLSNGLPQNQAYDLVYRHCLEVDNSGHRLIMGSTTGSLWVSENAGDSWKCLTQHLPPIYCVRFI